MHESGFISECIVSYTQNTSDVQTHCVYVLALVQHIIMSDTILFYCLYLLWGGDDE